MNIQHEFIDGEITWGIHLYRDEQWSWIIDFYDVTHNNFVSGYYAYQIMVSEGGLNLEGGVPAWTISPEGMGRVRAIIAETI